MGRKVARHFQSPKISWRPQLPSDNPSDPQHSSISLTTDSAIAGGVLGTDMPRLRQCDVGRRGKQSTRQTAVCDECCCTARLFSMEMRPHHTAAPGPSLVYARHSGSNSNSLCLPSVACMAWLCHTLHENCIVWQTWTRNGDFVPLRRSS